MTDPELSREILDQLGKLTAGEQRRVLAFARLLVSKEPQGISGRDLLRLRSDFDPEDLETMARIIEEDCERVDLNEW
ncbi:MAG: hypothetical protein HYS33_08895 [Acidobacteria bacterium]|nr:hypothetical protein [Acidobacteriota bacterium]MBI1982732.1 hypothetical protein [Acidobacteriota bacterium]